MKPKHFLVHNQGGVELHVVLGPLTGAKIIERALIELVANTPELQSDGEDSVHLLSISPKSRPHITSFSGGYMNNIRWVAGGCHEPQPDTWDDSSFQLVTHDEWSPPSSDASSKMP